MKRAKRLTKKERARIGRLSALMPGMSVDAVKSVDAYVRAGMEFMLNPKEEKS